MQLKWSSPTLLQLHLMRPPFFALHKPFLICRKFNEIDEDSSEEPKKKHSSSMTTAPPPSPSQYSRSASPFRSPPADRSAGKRLAGQQVSARLGRSRILPESLTLPSSLAPHPRYVSLRHPSFRREKPPASGSRRWSTRPTACAYKSYFLAMMSWCCQASPHQGRRHQPCMLRAR